MSAPMTDENGQKILIQKLFKCVKEGNINDFKLLLPHLEKTESWHTHCYDRSGNNIGIFAARWGRVEILRDLHERCHLGLELCNYEGKRPLHEAAQFGQLECVTYLLKHGVDVNSLKRADWTPLMLACTKDNLSVIQELVTHGGDLNRQNKDGWNCFHLACREGHPEIVSYLLDCDLALHDNVSKNGRTPLHTTALHGCLDVTHLLLTRCHYGADVKDSCETTPFMDAIRAGHVGVAQLLVDKQKVNIAAKDKLTRQAIHLAAEVGCLVSIEYLLDEHHVDVNLKTGSGTTPLHFAAKEGHESMLRLLLERGADVGAADEKHRTALHMASGGQYPRCVQILLEKGAVDSMDSNGRTARDLAQKPQVKDCFTNIQQLMP